MKAFRLLALGDIVGPRGAEYVAKTLWRIRKKYGVNAVAVNAENCAEPNGIDRESAELLLANGADVITTGNHVWRKSSIFSYLDDENRILRPLNYPDSNPGHGDCIIDADGVNILFMNVLGEAFMEACGSPFEAVERSLARNEGKYDFAVLDIHAEATGEKKAIAYSFADKVSVIYGTHTHVQTADAQIIDSSCGYITDLGMCGATDSILGVKKEAVIHKLRTKMMAKFDFAEGDIECQGAIFDINTDTWKAFNAKNIKYSGDIQ